MKYVLWSFCGIFLHITCWASNKEALPVTIKAIGKTKFIKSIKIHKKYKKYAPVLGILKKELKYKFKFDILRIENSISFKEGRESAKFIITIPF